MVTGDLSYLFESAIFDIINPGGEVFHNVAWHFLQLLPHPLTQIHPIYHAMYHTPAR